MSKYIIDRHHLKYNTQPNISYNQSLAIVTLSAIIAMVIATP